MHHLTHFKSGLKMYILIRGIYNCAFFSLSTEDLNRVTYYNVCSLNSL